MLIISKVYISISTIFDRIPLSLFSDVFATQQEIKLINIYLD